MQAFLALLGCYDPPPLDLGVDDAARCGVPAAAEVACVIDGDTVDLVRCGDGGVRVRLLGVDAPEVGRRGAASECWADEATDALRARVQGRRVRLSFDERCEDVYGRTLAWLWADGTDGTLNRWLVSEGHARLYGDRRPEGVRYDELADAEQRARAAGRGLWGACEVPSGARRRR